MTLSVRVALETLPTHGSRASMLQHGAHQSSVEKHRLRRQSLVIASALRVRAASSVWGAALWVSPGRAGDGG